jgi:hypothetical protein
MSKSSTRRPFNVRTRLDVLLTASNSIGIMGAEREWARTITYRPITTLTIVAPGRARDRRRFFVTRRPRHWNRTTVSRARETNQNRETYCAYNIYTRARTRVLSAFLRRARGSNRWKTVIGMRARTRSTARPTAVSNAHFQRPKNARRRFVCLQCFFSFRSIRNLQNPSRQRSTAGPATKRRALTRTYRCTNDDTTSFYIKWVLGVETFVISTKFVFCTIT